MSKQSLGSYDVTKSTTYKSGWRLRHTSFLDGKRVYKVVPTQTWNALGFSASMNIEEAKARAAQLNAERSLEREKIRKSVDRHLSIVQNETVYLPKLFVDEFTQSLLTKRNTGDRHRKKLVSHWRHLVTLIAKLKILPADYAENAERIYDYFAEEMKNERGDIVKRSISPEYALKLVNLLNRYGRFICKKQGREYTPVPLPKGQDFAVIADAYERSPLYVGESLPLSPELLESKKEKLTVRGNYEWLYLSVWLGLRPEEVDRLKVKNDRHWFITRDDKKNVDVLHVYQTKLSSVVSSMRWKLIPIFLPEQEKAIAIIKAGNLKTPSYKTMREVFPDGHYTLRAGRKGFTDLMLNLDQDFFEISFWLGHLDVETTWNRYRNKKRVSFRAPKLA